MTFPASVGSSPAWQSALFHPEAAKEVAVVAVSSFVEALEAVKEVAKVAVPYSS